MGNAGSAIECCGPCSVDKTVSSPRARLRCALRVANALHTSVMSRRVGEHPATAWGRSMTIWAREMASGSRASRYGGCEIHGRAHARRRFTTEVRRHRGVQLACTGAVYTRLACQSSCVSFAGMQPIIARIGWALHTVVMGLMKFSLVCTLAESHHLRQCASRDRRQKLYVP